MEGINEQEVEGQGWFLDIHTFRNYVKVAFRGRSRRPVPLASPRARTGATSTCTRTTSSTKLSSPGGSSRPANCRVKTRGSRLQGGDDGRCHDGDGHQHGGLVHGCSFVEGFPEDLYMGIVLRAQKGVEVARESLYEAPE
jgi:hypothetical protein